MIRPKTDNIYNNNIKSNSNNNSNNLIKTISNNKIKINLIYLKHNFKL